MTAPTLRSIRSFTGEAIGWAGAAAVLIAYLLLSQGWLPRGALYHALNLFGAIGIVLVSWRRATWQPFALNLIWAAIALLALLRGNP